MTKPLKLCLPLKTFEALASTADGRGQFCRVRKQDLLALLMDHGKVLGLLEDMQVKVEEPS